MRVLRLLDVARRRHMFQMVLGVSGGLAAGRNCRRRRADPAIAVVIGRHLDLPLVAVAPEDATGCFSWLASTFLAIDSWCSAH
jgi:hypothetical protein